MCLDFSHFYCGVSYDLEFWIGFHFGYSHICLCCCVLCRLHPNGSDHFTGTQEQVEKARDWPRAEEEMTYGSPRCVLIKDLDYKLVFRPLGVSEFYDLNQDPRELNNLYGVTKNKTYLNVINTMMMNLTSWFVQTADGMYRYNILLFLFCNKYDGIFIFSYTYSHGSTWSSEANAKLFLGILK